MLFFSRLHDVFWDSRGYLQKTKKISALPLVCEKLDFSQIDVCLAEQFWSLYKKHSFDLLGSGWVDCGFLDNAVGFENFQYHSLELQTDAEGKFLRVLLPRSCLKRSTEIWRHISGPYSGINWQKDFKSGYQWTPKSWYNPLKIADCNGWDIKVPWELGRLQHLPRFAIFYHILPDKKEYILREYCNQLLDFFAQNPVRWGVQSMCSMDMGIRVANIALSYTLFKSGGAVFPPKIEEIIGQEIYMLCKHIFHNLEWSDHYTNNHYLADLAGLLYGSSVLEKNVFVNRWNAFAISELQREFKKQFNEEGTNKEGSTFYHRLSSEIMVWSTALMYCLDKTFDIENRHIMGSLIFIKALTRPDGLLTAIGDNDSGQFFRLSFSGNGVHEEPNDAGAVISALTSVAGAESFKNHYYFEYTLIKAFVGSSVILPSKHLHIKCIPFEPIDTNVLRFRKHFEINSGGLNLTEKIEAIPFPQFGVYIIRSENIYLCFSLADIGQAGNGGHAHNDKLSFELFIGKEAVFEDPGTYVYTASKTLRDQYRSVKAHNTIYAGEEQNNFINTFRVKNECQCHISVFNDKQITAKAAYRDIVHVREIKVYKSFVSVTDYCNKHFTYPVQTIDVCRGYGRLTNFSNQNVYCIKTK